MCIRDRYKAEESDAKMKEADANVKSIWNTEWLSMQMGICLLYTS